MFFLWAFSSTHSIVQALFPGVYLGTKPDPLIILPYEAGTGMIFSEQKETKEGVT